MTVIDLDSRRKNKRPSLSELCNKFIEKADPVIGAQMDRAQNGRWRLLASETLLSAVESAATSLSNTELAESCILRRADNMAGFIWKGETPETIFQLLLGEVDPSMANQARDKGLDNLARALEVEPV